jgi:HEAT repeat protein
VSERDVAIRVEALSSTNAAEEAAARHSLVAMGAPALPHLEAALVDTARPYAVRSSVAWILGEIGDKRAGKPLKKVWSEKKAPGPFKIQVAIALASLGDPAPLRTFVSPLTKDKVLAAKAAIGLANVRDTGAIKALRELAQDEAIGTFVRLALARLGDDPGQTELRNLLKTKMFRSQAALGLARLGDKTVVYQLRFCLADPDPFVRSEAAELLGKLGDLESTEKIAKLATDDGDRRVRAASQRAAKRLERERRRRR